MICCLVPCRRSASTRYQISTGRPQSRMPRYAYSRSHTPRGAREIKSQSEQLESALLLISSLALCSARAGPLTAMPLRNREQPATWTESLWKSDAILMICAIIAPWSWSCPRREELTTRRETNTSHARIAETSDVLPNGLRLSGNPRSQYGSGKSGTSARLTAPSAC